MGQYHARYIDSCDNCLQNNMLNICLTNSRMLDINFPINSFIKVPALSENFAIICILFSFKIYASDSKRVDGQVVKCNG